MSTNEPHEATDSSERIPHLVADLAVIVRHEFELAKQELGEKVKAAGLGVGMLSGAALTGFMTLACLTALIAVLLSIVMPSWTAVLIVTVVWGAATAALAAMGKKKVEAASPFIPERTIADLKEDVEWARRRGKRSST
jgi:hypothetical protein